MSPVCGIFTTEKEGKKKDKHINVFFQEGVLYVRLVGVLHSGGHPVDKYTAATADKLAALGYTPQDMHWAENCQTKYMAAQSEMMCG